MTKVRQIGIGLAPAVMFAVMIELLPGGGLILMACVGVMTIIGLLFGVRLPLSVRVFVTVIVFYFGFNMCLVGRTMSPGLTGYTMGMAVFYFMLFASVPAISLFRLWRGKAAFLFAFLVLPLSLVTAEVVAGGEEYLFVKKYEATGVGTTERWTVSNHWLAYDRETHRLYGSD